MSLQASSLCLENTRAKALYAARAVAPVRCTRETLEALRRNAPYQNVAELLLSDPRKRALLRTIGTDETFVTGKGADLEVFRAFCAAMEGAPASAAKLQCHAALQWLLDIDLTLCAAHADRIWQQSAERLLVRDLTPRSILQECGVETLSVALAPTDGLQGLSKCGVQVRPLFCPDALLDPKQPAFLDTVLALSKDISTLQALQAAVLAALDRFCEMGCVSAVHTVLPRAFSRPDPYHAEQAFLKCLRCERLTDGEADLLTAQMWRILGQAYIKRGMMLELATGGVSAGALPRYVRPAMLCTDYVTLRILFDYLKECDALPPIVLYLSSSLEVREAVAFGELYPATKEGKAQVCFGIVGGSAAEERALLLALASALPLGAIAGRFTDFRLPTSLLDGELYARQLCTLLSDLEEEGTLQLTPERTAALVRRLTGENATKLFQ